MRFSALAFAACFGALTVAQSTSIADLPVCARNCVGSNLGGCNPIDVRCICSNTDYISGLSCCVLNSCSPEDQQRTIDFAVGICRTAQIQVPTRASCPGASSTASSSAPSASSSASSAASSVASSVSSSVASQAASGTSTAASAAQATTNAASHNIGSGLGAGFAVAGLVVLL